MSDGFEAQMDAARRQKESQRRAAEDAAAKIRRETEHARLEAMALVPEVKAAVAALRRAHDASTARLRQGGRWGQSGDVSLVWKKGMFGERPIGWSASGMTIPFSGEPTLMSPAPRGSRLSIDAYAHIGRFEWGTYDGTNGHQTHSRAAADAFRAAIKAIAKHLADLG